MELRAKLNYFLNANYKIRTSKENLPEEKVLSDQQCFEKFKKDYPPNHIR